jgi:HAD superfamily hydrolase (TIGR01662 family)
MPKLILFDLDGTLAEYKTGVILPNVRETLAALPKRQKLCVVSNQGGVGFRYWMETDGFGNAQNLPTEADARAHVAGVLKALKLKCPAYLSFAYQSNKSGKWNPTPSASQTESLENWRQDWRKPRAGMLTQAMIDFSVKPDDMLMVGDWNEDRLAAFEIGCAFQLAKDFFGREE